MVTREILEEQERQRLSPRAALSANSRGREKPYEPCPLRTCYQRDRDRILHSKSFRRLKFKTQVFFSPESDHVRTRLTHTLEVAQVGRTMARALALNEDLAEAIALGHDLGHTPFGHSGEHELAKRLEGGFHHNEQSLRVVERLEQNGEGLNLTWEVRDGILHHRGKQLPATLEGECVALADRIAYLNHDIDDAIRANVLRETDLPAFCRRVLGKTHGERINNIILDLVTNSDGKEHLSFSDDVNEGMNELRDFMFQRVYLDPWVKEEEDKCKQMVGTLFDYYLAHPGEMPVEYVTIAYQEGTERGVADFIAGMTDRYAVRTFTQLYVPKAYPL